MPSQLEVVLDPDWLIGALADVRQDERIVDVEQLDRSQTLAHKVRVGVTVEAGDGSRRRRAYCIKAHFDDGPATLLPEAYFYRDLRPLLDLRAPRAYYTGIDDPSGRALVIMDDVVSGGGRFLSAHQPYAVATCHDTLAQLARLHATTWSGEQWAGDWAAPRIASIAGLFPAEVVQQLLDDGRGVGVADELLDAGRLLRAMETTAAVAPTCVIHGDTHSGNVYLDASGRACWLDWQLTQWGHWAIDVSYHIATVLDVEDRRAHEQELLRSYLDELGNLGVEPPPWKEAWHRYTLGFTWGFFLWVITRVSSRAVVLLHMPRLGAALADHDTFRRLGAA